MKTKTIVVFAVLAMFLASSACVAVVAADSGDSSNLRKVEAGPLYLDKNGVVTGADYGTLEDYNAEYDSTEHILTLNGGVEVDCKCVGDSTRCLIHIADVGHVKIVVKGETILKCDTPGKYTSGQAPVGIFATSGSNVNTITLSGDGSLTLKPSTTSQANIPRGIWGNNVYIEGCTINFDFGSNTYNRFRAIEASNNISVYNATINITGNGTAVLASGIAAGKSVEIQHSVFTAKNVATGIGPTDEKKDIYCTIYNSVIDITGCNNIVNNLINCKSSLNINYTELKAKCGSFFDSTVAEEKSFNYCIRSNMINISESVVDLKGTQGGISRLVYFEGAMLIKYSTLTCEGYGYPQAGTTDNQYSAIHGLNQQAMLSADCSSITVKFNSVRDSDYGFNCISVFYHCDVTVENTTAKAFNPDKAIFFDGTFVSLQGVEGSGSYKDITVDKIKDCKKIRFVSERIAFFDINGGIGTAVSVMDGLSVGQEITLPECDAKRDGLVFVGWDDGEKIYQPGDKYVINSSTYFTAVYGEDHSGAAIDEHAAIIAIAACVAVTALGVALVSRRIYKN